MMRAAVMVLVSGAILGACAAWAGSHGYDTYAESHQKVEYACSQRVCRA